MNLIQNYIVSPTHQWWVDNVWRPTWTRLVAWVYGLPAMIATGAQAVGAWAGNDQVQTLLDKMHVPASVPPVLASIALVHLLAKGHD